MSFESTGTQSKEPSILWTIRQDTKHPDYMMEIKDEMNVKGVIKRAMFSPADSTWIMTLAYNMNKQAVKVHSSSMYRDSVQDDKKITFKKTTEQKRIQGILCRKVIFESEKYYSEVWVSDSFKVELAKLYGLMSHCGMAGEFIRKGDWYKTGKVKGMILEVYCREKKTGASYTIRISSIHTGSVDDKIFSLSGFKISEIPEGQSCTSNRYTEE